MKIVDVTEFYSERGGGIRSHLTNRGHFLCQQGHDHLVIAPGPRDEDALASPSVAGGRTRLARVAGPPQPYDPTYHLLYRLDKVRRRALFEQPDVLEAHSPYLASAAVMACGPRAARIRTAFWHSDHLGVYVEPTLEGLLGETAARGLMEPLWQGVRALLSPFDAVFAAGRAQFENLRRAGVPRVVHAPFGVDVDTFRPSAFDQEWRDQWRNGARERPAILVGVGRFALEKRWDVVIDATVQLRRHRAAILLLFGDGPERARLERRADSGVRFVGFEQDRGVLATALASADLLVHGSPYETFGLSLAEAVACGLPVVVPDRGAAVEHAQPGCGEAYRSLDSESCAIAMARVLDRPAEERRARALEAAATVPSSRQHFGQVLATYRELLARPVRVDAWGRPARREA